MNVFKREMNRLKKCEKIIDKYLSYRMHSIAEFYNVRKALEELEYGKDFQNYNFSDKAYYTLMKKYGIPNLTIYENRLRVYTFHSNEIKWFLQKQRLTLEQYSVLIKYYIKIKQYFVDLW